MIDLEALKAALTRTGRARELTLPGGDAILDRWRAGLDEFVAYYQDRFDETINPFDWLNANPAKARAFFDPDTLSLSPAMKAAVWRILLNFDIRKVELVYQLYAPSVLRVELSALGTADTEVFESGAAEDAKLLRHLGSIRVNGQFQLQGYYAFATPAV